LNGSGLWRAEQAWLGDRPGHFVLIEVRQGRIQWIKEDVGASPDAIELKGWTIPGLANVHSHAFQRGIRGFAESEGADFWAWREAMYRNTYIDPDRYREQCRLVFHEMLEAGITAVGEFHYLHDQGNAHARAMIKAAKDVGIRLTLIDACYLRGGLDGRPLEGQQRTFSDGDVVNWTKRMNDLRNVDGIRIASAIHSVRAVDPASMRAVAAYARARRMPLHIHLAEQPAEVEECRAVEDCTPTELLDREGILGSDLTAVHAIHVDDHDIELLGKYEVSVCACPTTERDLGDRVGPLRALADAGCGLTVGSDSNAVIDILEEARGLELDQRRAMGRRVIHAPEALFHAATVGGMRALGWETAGLMPGMLADFVTIRSQEALSAANVIFGASGCDVTNVVVGGRTLVSK
jgi:formiminoglutamate deiminase